MDGTSKMDQMPKGSKAMPTFWDSVMDDVDKGRQLTEEEVTSYWDSAARDGTTEKAVELFGYGAQDVLKETMEELFPGNRSEFSVLDVGTCTGFSGRTLYQLGFRDIDGIDPSSESRRVAQQKGVYRKLMNLAITAEPLKIPENTYDAAVALGSTGPKHVPLGAFTEMIRLVKPGGYIVNLTRTSNLDRCPEYVNHWTAMIEEQKKAGTWRLVKKEVYPCHFNDRPGYKHVFQVC